MKKINFDIDSKEELKGDPKNPTQPKDKTIKSKLETPNLDKITYGCINNRFINNGPLVIPSNFSNYKISK